MHSRNHRAWRKRSERLNQDLKRRIAPRSFRNVFLLRSRLLFFLGELDVARHLRFAFGPVPIPGNFYPDGFAFRVIGASLQSYPKRS
jgi:hypothetical protein